MITAEQIKGVNERVKKIEVKGKNYACVAARVAAFRELCPNGAITTDILSLENGVVTMRTTVSDETGKVLATGMAQEKEESSYINKTSFIENCETSAVGRALGMLGIGSDEQMASAEETANAINNKNTAKPAERTKEPSINDKITAPMVKTLRKMAGDHKMPEAVITERYRVKSIEDLTFANWRNWAKTGEEVLKHWDETHKAETDDNR